VGTVARTAVIAGTATAVSNRVSRRQDAKYQEQQAATSTQAELDDVEAQLGAMQAQQAQASLAGGAAGAASAAAAPPDLVAQLNQLASLKASGVISDQEFDAAKAKLLGS
jgi:hypothetical protein